MLELFLPLAFMLSPGALKSAANGAGAAGVLFIFFLLFSAACALSSSSAAGSAGSGGRASRAIRVTGLGVADASRLLALFSLVALWLAQAGQYAHELFLPWMSAASCTVLLVALVFAASLLSMPYRSGVLYVAALLALGGIGYIGAMATQPHGLEAWFPTMFPPKRPPLFPTGGDVVQAAYLALLTLLGFELAVRPSAGRGAARAVLALALACGVYCLLLWGGLSAAVPRDLALSTEPQVLIASLALGKRGRQIMGAVMVVGGFAAALALVQTCTAQIQCLLRKPTHEGLRKITAFFLCLGVATMLASGWTGEPRLESLINAALFCWFAAYALLNLSRVLSGPLPALALAATLAYVFACGVTLAPYWNAILSGAIPRTPGYAVGGVCAMALLFALSHKRGQSSPPRNDTAPAQDTKS